MYEGTFKSGYTFVNPIFVRRSLAIDLGDRLVFELDSDNDLLAIASGFGSRPL